MKNHYLPFLFFGNLHFVKIKYNGTKRHFVPARKRPKRQTHEVKTQKATLDLNKPVTVKIDKKHCAKN